MGIHSFELSDMLGINAGAVLRSQGTGIGVHGVTCGGGSFNACAIAGLASACGKIPPVTDAKTIATGKVTAFDRTVRTLLCMIILLSEGWLKLKNQASGDLVGSRLFLLPNRSKRMGTEKELEYAETRIDKQLFGDAARHLTRSEPGAQRH
jgi:hypothetical protein